MTNFPSYVTSFLSQMNAAGNFWLVGGAVRDALTGREPHDFDFTTTTPEVLEGKFPFVGKGFPVWMVKHEGHSFEVAAARIEKRTGPKHSDFSCEVTRSLELDLLRRDLTVNAIAWRPEEGFTYAPGSQRDLELKVLRHTTDAFAEDALRVYRVARFASTLGWNVYEPTLVMCQNLYDSLPFLYADRVRTEFLKAMKSPEPHKFFYTLRDCDCLRPLENDWFREVAALMGCEQGPTHHPEGDVFVHTLGAMRWVAAHMPEGVQWSKYEQDIVVMAALCHDLGKPLVRSAEGTFHDHDEKGLPLVKTLCERLSLGKRVQRALCFAMQNHHRVHKVQELRPGSLTKLVMGAERTQLGLEGLLRVCEADHWSRGAQFELEAYPQTDYLRKAAELIAAVDFSNVENMSAVKRENILNHAVRPLTKLRKVKKM